MRQALDNQLKPGQFDAIALYSSQSVEHQADYGAIEILRYADREVGRAPERAEKAMLSVLEKLQRHAQANGDDRGNDAYAPLLVERILCLRHPRAKSPRQFHISTTKAQSIDLKNLVLETTKEPTGETAVFRFPSALTKVIANNSLERGTPDAQAILLPITDADRAALCGMATTLPHTTQGKQDSSLSIDLRDRILAWLRSEDNQTLNQVLLD